MLDVCTYLENGDMDNNYNMNGSSNSQAYKHFRGIKKKPKNKNRFGVDSGLIVIIFMIVVYLALLFYLLLDVNNDFCNLLFPNGTVILLFHIKYFCHSFIFLFKENLKCMPGYYIKKSETFDNVEIKY